MKGVSFRVSLIDSAAELGYGPESFWALDEIEGAEVAAAIERVFGDAANGAMTGWWHSDQPCPVPRSSRAFRDGRGWRHLTAVAPSPVASVWLLTENWDRGRPGLFVFASTAAVVQEVLGNTHGFEYIVSGQGFDWLFAEDHEDCISVAGAEAVERLGSITN